MKKLANQRLYDVISGSIKGEAAADALKGVSSEELRNFVTKNKLSGEQISKLTAGGMGAEKLSLGQNIRALGAEGKGLFSGGVKNAPKRMFQAGIKGMKEGGGGWRGSAGTKQRYLAMGGKAMAVSQALPGVRDAFKKVDPTGKGRSQTERLFTSAGEVAGGVLTSLPNSVTNRLGLLNIPLSIGGSILGSSVGKKVGSSIGKTVDKGVSKVRGVAAGDATNQAFQDAIKKRKNTTGAI
tara:strand:+ start:132 stop:848 length:717 start_codon:yes stop_codon:yes gene_type:complete